jgi:small subunit ribosomal protein S8
MKMENDPLANALIHMKNLDNISEKEVVLKPASKLLEEVLKVLEKTKYIEKFEKLQLEKKGAFKVKLAGKINECKVIKPRFSVSKDGYEKYEKRFLPARDIGIIIVSTNKGLMTHEEAKREGLGGRLIAYAY